MNRSILLAMSVCIAMASSAHAQIKDGAIRMGVDSLPLSFGNPYRTAQIPTTFTTSAMFDGLTRIALDGTLNPWLATNWESQDGLTWRFKLRSDVIFSNGVPFTAEAVRVAVEYLAGPESVRETLNREISTLRSARVIDAHTVDITLAEPDAAFPRSAAALFIAEPGEWLRLGREEFGKVPVGTGPFKLVRWEPNRAVLMAHEQSWRKPKRRELEIVAIPEAASRTQALLAARIDAAVGLTPTSLEMVEQAGGQALAVPTAQVWGWAFVLTRAGKKVDSPMQDRRVRQALTMAVNRELIVETFLGNTARVAGQGATSAVYGYNPDIKPRLFDPAAAKKLLAEAGYPNGFSMTVMASGAAGVDADIHQRIAADLSAVGVNVEIRTVPIQQFLQFLGQGTFPTEAFGMSYPADPNIDAIRPLRIHSCLRRDAFYCDETIMPKIRAALVARDPDEALRLRREIVAWYHDEAPMLFVYEGTRFYGLGKKVRGFAEAHGYIAYDQIDFAP